jgi:hypothetical protein
VNKCGKPVSGEILRVRSTPSTNPHPRHNDKRGRLQTYSFLTTDLPLTMNATGKHSAITTADQMRASAMARPYAARACASTSTGMLVSDCLMAVMVSLDSPSDRSRAVSDICTMNDKTQIPSPVPNPRARYMAPKAGAVLLAGMCASADQTRSARVQRDVHTH